MIKTNFRIRLILLSFLVILLANSCDSVKKWEREEKAQIQLYLNEHQDLNFLLKPSGLYYLDEVVGSGPVAETHDTAFVMFTGYFLDGTKFLTNVGTTDTLIFPVNENTRLPGIDEAITYMREGGKSKVLLPSYLGYGNAGYYMTPYTPLLFELELKRLSKGSFIK